jgi:hypothetical protein
MAQSKLLQLSPQALFRYQLISAVQARVLAGMGLSRAVRDVVEQAHRDERGELRKVSERSLYSWLDAFEHQGLEGLEPEPRPRLAGSTVLPAKLLNFLRNRERGRPRSFRPRAHSPGSFGRYPRRR